jgi:hypothetical protein
MRNGREPVISSVQPSPLSDRRQACRRQGTSTANAHRQRQLSSTSQRFPNRPWRPPAKLSKKRADARAADLAPTIAELQAAGATSLRAIAVGPTNDESRQLAAGVRHRRRSCASWHARCQYRWRDWRRSPASALRSRYRPLSDSRKLSGPFSFGEWPIFEGPTTKRPIEAFHFGQSAPISMWRSIIFVADMKH